LTGEDVADDDKQVLTTDVIAAVVAWPAGNARVAAHATTAAGIQSAIDGASIQWSM
jgi:hypothetical protein